MSVEVDDVVEFQETTNGVVELDNAVNTTIDRPGAEVQWMVAGSDLFLGTASGELTCHEQSIAQAFGPTNIKVDPQTDYGSNGAKPVRVDNAVFYLDPQGIILRKMAASFLSAAYTTITTAPSQVDVAEHILKPYSIQVKYAPNPFPSLVCTRVDGEVARYAYNEDEKVLAWSRTVMGGYIDASKQDAAQVLCTAVVPSPDGDDL